MFALLRLLLATAVAISGIYYMMQYDRITEITGSAAALSVILALIILKWKPKPKEDYIVRYKHLKWKPGEFTRHWLITDGTGKIEEVRGPGVVGETPTLAPGETYTYTSGCPLTTPFGMMQGTYQMVTKDGEEFDVTIAPFTLSEPYTVH